MEFRTVDHWDEELWLLAEPVYVQAFPKHGRKNRQIIQRLFEKEVAFLHVAIERSEVIAMALTGRLDDLNALLIDYLAVRKDLRGQGIGRVFMGLIRDWTVNEAHFDGILIETEAEISESNINRIRFWESCGFTLTDYVHHYIWVPEPYRAMYLNLHPTKALPTDGETLFRYITRFHSKAYRGK